MKRWRQRSQRRRYAPRRSVQRGGKVLHFIGRLDPGGVEVRTLELVEALADADLEHHVVALSGERGLLDADYAKAGARVSYLDIKKPYFPLALVRLLRREKIDVVHANVHYPSGVLLALAWFAGVRGRVVQFQSDGRAMENATWARRARNSVLKKLIDLFATEIVGLTPDGLRLAWRENWEADPRCRVVPNGVEVTRGNALPPSHATPSLEDVRDSTSVILHVGRGGLESKRRARAVEIFARYAAVRPNSVLVFVGRDGTTEVEAAGNRATLQSSAARLGVADRVRFAGEVRNVGDFLSRGDLFLFTSKLEGLPGVVLEALAAGLPVVSTDLPGVKFIAEHMDVDALLPIDAAEQEWVDQMVTLPAKLDAEERGRRAERVRGSAFDLEVAKLKYLSLWAKR